MYSLKYMKSSGSSGNFFDISWEISGESKNVINPMKKKNDRKLVRNSSMPPWDIHFATSNLSGPALALRSPLLVFLVLQDLQNLILETCKTMEENNMEIRILFKKVILHQSSWFYTY